ncbi:MAG: SGNH/GDSL hydrolase family protein [Bacteroidetes bacterium]|nr:SGNH/GDSL hydrolase family protein [Bacteroidota bacterium]
MNPIQKYLALGDSYTIGEAVRTEESFPGQLVSLLRSAGHPVEQWRVIAKTGWTTDELIRAIEEAEKIDPIACDQDLVTLLIGVNNQYRGRSVSEFAVQFQDLLKRAVHYAGNNPERIRVLSIPDWGITPFAADRDREEISRQIDLFNEEKKSICERAGIHYIYITDLTREAKNRPELITTDGLHPSGIDYFHWAKRVWSSLKSSRLIGF